MSKWIRGRLGRPIAGIMSIMMLATILLPLASPPAQAQAQAPPSADSSSSAMDWGQLDSLVSDAPIPLAVLDFNNRSSYRSGAISREMADSLSLAFEGTGKYTVVKRQQVLDAMDELGLSVPLSFDAQAQLAERLNVPFVVTGEIENVTTMRTKDGTFVEAVLNALVISRVTRLPINGARLTAKSSPKLGYTTIHMDPLVQEAISTGSFAIVNRIMDNRMPIGSVLNPSQEGIVRIRGGSVIGIREGMRLVAVRHGSVSGLLRVDTVTSIDATCTITEDRIGVAPGDKIVPYYTPENLRVTTEVARSRSVAALLPWVAAGLLTMLVSHSKEAATKATITASPVADADPLSYPNGANYITWSKQGNSTVLKYIVYRVFGTEPIPVAVVGANQNWYIDTGSVPDISTTISGSTGQTIYAWTGTAIDYMMTIDPNMAGPVFTEDSATPTIDTWNWTFDSTTLVLKKDTYPTDLLKVGVKMTDVTSIEVNAVQTPLMPGDSCAYAVQPIYYSWTPGSSSSGSSSSTSSGVDYALNLGEMSLVSPVMIMTAVPQITNPAVTDTVMSGTFDCTAPQNSTGVLQLSADPFFRDEKTVTVTTTPVQLGANIISPFTGLHLPFDTWQTYGQEAVYPLANILSNSKLIGSSSIYMRMGIKYVGNPPARPRQMSSYSTDAGYVFSAVRTFNVTRVMLMDRLMLSGSPSQIGPVSPLKSSPGRPSSRRHLFAQ